MSDALSSLTSTISSVSTAFRGVNQAARGIGRLAADLSSFEGGTAGKYGQIGPGLGPWADGLQPGSWRGMGFATTADELRRGRRVVVHEYPFGDQVWVEDLGRGTRTFGFQAFIVGDDVYDELTDWIEAAETAGPAELIHPALGSVTAALVDFSSRTRADLGRVVELQLGFIETLKDPPVPETAGNTGSAAAQAGEDGKKSFFEDLVDDVKSGYAWAAKGVKTVEKYGKYAMRLAGDAGLVVHAVTGVTGAFGRYSKGSRGRGLQAVTGSVSQAIGTVNAARSAVNSAARAANSIAALL